MKKKIETRSLESGGHLDLATGARPWEAWEVLEDMASPSSWPGQPQRMALRTPRTPDFELFRDYCVTLG